LKHIKASLEEAVKRCPRTFYQELATKKLHSEKSKDENKENEENQQSNNGRYGVDQRLDQVTHRRPVSSNKNRINING
jgi:hypothetical protein